MKKTSNPLRVALIEVKLADAACRRSNASPTQYNRMSDVVIVLYEILRRSSIEDIEKAVR